MTLRKVLFIPAFFNRCARCTLGCTKIYVGCTTTKGFTRVHHKRVTLNRYFSQKTKFLFVHLTHILVAPSGATPNKLWHESII